MEIQPQAGRDNPRDVIDLSKMTSNHVWNTNPLDNVNFRNLVEESTSARTDMLQYRSIAQVDVQGAKDTFSLIPNNICVFKIPEAIACDRTFARGSSEAYYLDAMDQYLRREPEELKIEDIPLLQRSLNNHSFNSFRKRVDYFKEHMERRRIQRWILSDAYEACHFSDMQLAELFPKVEAWINDVFQPPGLPIPCPFVAYYFHLELRKCQGRPWDQLTEREKRLVFCLQHEYYLLMIVFWWKEAVHGGRQYVLNQTTINTLNEKSGNITDILGKPAQVIIEHMRSAAAKPEMCHNWMLFGNDEMEESTFVWAKNGTNEAMPGEFDPYEPSGITLWCNLKNRRIATKRNSAATFRRGRSLLDKVVTVSDLERIRGLVPIMETHGWDRRGNIKLSHLLENLVNLHNCTSGLLQQVTGRGLDVPAIPSRQNACFNNTPLLYDRSTEERSGGREVAIYNATYTDRERNYHNGEQRERVESSYQDYDRQAHHRDEPFNYRSRGDMGGRRTFEENAHRRQQCSDPYAECEPYRGYEYYDRYRPGNERERGHQYGDHEPERGNHAGQQSDFRDYGGHFEHGRDHCSRDEGNGERGGPGGYHDLDDSTQYNQGYIQQSTRGDRYHRTHDPITDVDVDVYKEGKRTPAVNNPLENRAQTLPTQADEILPNSQQQDPPASQGNRPDQANEDQPMTDTRLAIGTVKATPRHVPESVRHLLSKNQVSNSIRSDARKSQNQLVPVNKGEHVKNVPAGNFPWLLQDALNTPRENAEERSGDGNAKRAKLDQHEGQTVHKQREEN